MRHLIFLFFLFICVVGSSQTIYDYNNTTNRDAKLRYDESFNPYVELSLTNVSSKFVTTIVFEVYYKDRSKPQEDISTVSIESVVVPFSIPPKQRKTVRFGIPKGRGNASPSAYTVKKVRYEDGTICE